MLGRYEIHVPNKAVSIAEEAIQGLQPEEIGKLLQPVTGYPEVPLPYAYENFGPIIAASIIVSNPELRTAPRDGTAFYSRRGQLDEATYTRLIEDEDAAIEGARRAGGLEIYVAGNPDDRNSGGLPIATNPFSFKPDNVSVCGWQTLNQAQAGAATTEHQRGKEHTRDYYGDTFGVVKFNYKIKEHPTGIVVAFKGREARQAGKPVQAAA